MALVPYSSQQVREYSRTLAAQAGRRVELHWRYRGDTTWRHTIGTVEVDEHGVPSLTYAEDGHSQSLAFPGRGIEFANIRVLQSRRGLRTYRTRNEVQGKEQRNLLAMRRKNQTRGLLAALLVSTLFIGETNTGLLYTEFYYLENVSTTYCKLVIEVSELIYHITTRATPLAT